MGIFIRVYKCVACVLESLTSRPADLIEISMYAYLLRIRFRYMVMASQIKLINIDYLHRLD